MRIRGDDGIALALIRDRQRHQRGMPSLARQDETFGQTDLETVVGIFGKLVGCIADERETLNFTHDEDTRVRVRGSPFIATEPLSVYCEEPIPLRN